MMRRIFGSKTSQGKTGSINANNEGNDFEKRALDLHNEYRREHGAEPLELSREICVVSQKYAKVLAKTDKMKRSSNKIYGENVYCTPVLNPNYLEHEISALECIDGWYREIKKYSFQEPEKSASNAGNFTQIVWRETKLLGIGYAISKSGKLYIVANYYPPGNIPGKFKDNVFSPGHLQFKPKHMLSESESEPSKASSKSSEVSLKSLPRMDSDLLDEFQCEFLEAHNEYRKKHGCRPLIMSRKLCEYADEWAMTLAKKGQLEQRNQFDYGENIYFAYSTDPEYKPSGKAIVEQWYNEIKDHEFGQDPKDMKSGHFTQVIWKECTEIGVGKSNQDGKWFVVAYYYPPGNMMGSFAEQVPPLIE